MVPHPCKPLPKFTTSSDKNENLLTGYPLMALQVAYMKMTGFLSRQEEPLKSYIIHIGIAIFVHLDDRYLCSKQKSTKTNKQTAGFVTTYLIDWFLSDDGLKATLFWGFYRTTQSQGMHKLGFHLALLSWHSIMHRHVKHPYRWRLHGHTSIIIIITLKCKRSADC